MRAIANCVSRAGTLVVLVATLAFAAVPAAAVAISQHKTPRAYAAAKEITERRARRVMTQNVRTLCRDMEQKITVTEKVRIDPMLPPHTIHRVVKNGTCKSWSVPYSTCDPGVWPDNDPDIYLQHRKFIACTQIMKWQTNKYTQFGICWEELGKPQDSNAFITASRVVEVGYDSRGALRRLPDPTYSCRAS
jgi:hypothetical protein